MQALNDLSRTIGNLSRTNRETQINDLSLRLSVGQLAKTPCPTLNPLLTKEKSVGRHSDGYARAGERAQARTHERKQQNGFSKGFSVRHFLEISDLLYPQIKTVFHNYDYVAAINEIYKKPEKELFFRLVRAFTLLRKSARLEPITGVFQSNEEDFWAAFRIMKLRSSVSKRKKTSRRAGKATTDKVFNYLQSNFANSPFTSVLIAQKTGMKRNYITCILTHLYKENRLTLISSNCVSGLRTFRLTS